MKPYKCHLWENDLDETFEINLGSTFKTLKIFENENHVIRRLFKCNKCNQLYFYEFYEVIDWEKGEDPQYLTLIPVKDEGEAENLSKMTQVGILKFSPRLQKDWGKGQEKPKGWKWVEK